MKRPRTAKARRRFHWVLDGAEGQSRTGTWSPPPIFELVAVRTTSPHQPLYVPQSCLQCTNAFHQTSGNIKYLVDVLVDEVEGLSSVRTSRPFNANRRMRNPFPQAGILGLVFVADSTKSIVQSCRSLRFDWSCPPWIFPPHHATVAGI